MNTVKIEDMPVVEEMNSEEMAAVHGGIDSLRLLAQVSAQEAQQPVVEVAGGLAGGLTGALSGVK